MKNSKFQIRNSKFRPRRHGYIALISLLIVAAAALTIGIGVSLTSISAVQDSFAFMQANRAKFLANSCVEEGLERLRENWANYSTSLSFAGGSCIINSLVDGNLADLTSEGTVDIFKQKIKIQVNQNLAVVNW